jgi:Sigma-70 region 2
MRSNRTMAGFGTMPGSAVASSVSSDQGAGAAQAVLHRDIECVLPSLRRYAHSLTYDAIDADDLVQECLRERSGSFTSGRSERT